MTVQSYRRDGRPAKPLRWTTADRIDDAARRLHGRWARLDMARFIVHDAPVGRIGAWNVGAVAFAAGDLWAAHRFGVLGWVMVALAGMVAATGVALVLTSRRIERGARRRVDREASRHWQVAPAGDRERVAA